MPSEHERETAFLKRCVRYDESAEGGRLYERIAHVQRSECSLRRASWLMGLVAALAVAGLIYGMVFMDDFPAHLSIFAAQMVIRIVCALGIGSLICLLTFSVVWFVHRRDLNKKREECRRLVMKLLESRLGHPPAHRKSELTESGDTSAPIAADSPSPLG